MSKQTEGRMGVVETIVLENAITVYGVENQIDMAIEEMSELTKALCKVCRGADDGDRDLNDELFDNVREEIADVEIMLVQMEMIFDKSHQTQEIVEAKVRRLSDRLAAMPDTPKAVD